MYDEWGIPVVTAATATAAAESAEAEAEAADTAGGGGGGQQPINTTSDCVECLCYVSLL